MIAFAALLAAWIFGEAILTSTDRPAPGALAPATGLLLLGSQAVAVATHGEPRWPGGVVLAAGIALRLVAIATLCATFRSALASERLCTTGVYRFARHPSELGLIFCVGGTAWLLGSGWSALVAAPLVVLSVVRCHREDRALAVHPEFAAWQRAVGWFVPRR